MPKRVLILGSTGSIGIQAIDVVSAHPDLVVCGLACGRDRETMAAQSEALGGVPTACAAGGGTIPADRTFARMLDEARPDIVLNAIVGSAGLRPTLAAVEAGLDVALANKESLVAGGDLVTAACARTGARLIPVDSEHSAMFQLLEGVDRAHVRSTVLTASGGPFRGRTRDELADVTIDDALAHPTWSMGAKITVDSATLMNKGLEVLEARHLFDLTDDEVEVVVHPQSFVHAMVRLVDGSVLTHCAPPDMRVPIGQALTWPDAPPRRAPVDLVGRTLEFLAPDEKTFRCLPLARAAGREGGTAPAVMNAANEAAVAAFLDGRARFLEIADLVEDALGAIPARPADDIEAVMAADAAAREHVEGRLGVHT